MLCVKTSILIILCANVLGKNIKHVPEEQSSSDNRLYLTPLIEKGQTEQAKKEAEVDPKLFAGVKSYSGFITVNKTFHSNTFFWYFPAGGSSVPVEDTPWIIWLQGGPGGSSLYGLFYEIGPLQVVVDKAEKMPITWGDDYSLLFIDNPVGTGFSFTDKGGYSTNENMVYYNFKFVDPINVLFLNVESISPYNLGEMDHLNYGKMDYFKVGSNLLNFLQQFLQVFPELRKAPLFICGESYAGKYIPAFGHYIHTYKNDSYPINLKGLAIGDGWTDPPTLLHNADFGLQLGMLSPEQSKEVNEHEEKARKLYAKGQFQEYFEEFNTAFKTFTKYSKLPNVYNFVENDFLTDAAEHFLNFKEIQNALHVGRTDFKLLTETVHQELLDDMFRSVKPWLEEMIEHYAVMCYSGQLDVIVAYALSVHTYQTLKWSKVEEYRKAERVPLQMDEKTKHFNSYVKAGGNFWDVMVRGAGHMVPHDKPRAAKQIIDMFISINK